MNDLIRPRQHIRRNRESDLFGGIQIDDELKFLRLLHREIGRLRAFQDFVYIHSGAPVQVAQVDAIGHKSAGFHMPWPFVHYREPALNREFCNLF